MEAMELQGFQWEEPNLDAQSWREEEKRNEPK